jgi:hypothetical protein
MDLSFNYKAAISSYESYILERCFNGSAYLTLKINKAMPNTDVLIQDNIIWFDKEYHKGFIIERVSEKLENDTRVLEIIASSLNALLRDYITIPPSGQDEHIISGSREAIVRSLVTANVINPQDASRSQYSIILGLDNGYGSATIARSRYKNLADEIVSVLSPEGLGWRIDIDLAARKFVFKVIKGVNRTAAQSVNPRVLFGTKYGNMSKFEKVKDRLSSRSVAFVGGTGDGKDRLISKVTDTNSVRKKEIFIDARNINNAPELIEKGKQSLSQYGEVSSFTFETLNRQFEYGIDWDLGDYVTIVSEDGTSDDRQAIKVTEYLERNSVRVVPEFGTPEITVNQKFSSIEQRVSLMESEEVKVIGFMPGLDADLIDGVHLSSLAISTTSGASDLNTIIASGAYRVDVPAANGVAGCEYGQMLVLHGAADTITQILTAYSDQKMYIRSGNPAQVGGYWSL